MSKRIVRTALVSNKAPHPTTFSNSRSNYYLTHEDNFVPPQPDKQSNKFFINLQDLLIISELIEGFSTSIESGQSTLSDSERWWTITDISSLLRIDRIFKTHESQMNLKEAVILQSLCVGLTSFLDISLPSIKGSLLELFQLTYQNYLILIDIILHRLPSSYTSNSWAIKLQTLTYQKRLSKCHKSENMLALRRQSNIIREKIKEFANSEEMLNRVLRDFLQILRDVDRLDVLTARDMIKHMIREEPYNTTESLEYDGELPIVEPPYLPQQEPPGRLTLVLDLDETLVHYVENGIKSALLVRPGCNQFIEEISKYYELVIFTAALQDYADWAIDQLSAKHCFSGRLYRQHTSQTGNFYIKDLSRIGRDVAKTIIVDNVAENFQLQPDNGILIRTWIEDPKDNALLELLPLLRQISIKNVKDVRKALRSFRDQMMRQVAMGISNPHLNLHLDEEI